MSFINIPWLSESLKKRALRYLLQRYLGHVLLEKLTLEQLSVDLYDGKGCIRDLALDVEGLNEELVFLPFKFVDGCYINQITCSVPWSDLLKDSCSLEIDGATLVCQITGKESSSKTIYESSYLSKSMMSSSMQMAEEIVQEEPEEGKFDGLEMMAQLIDSVLRRVKVIATNTSFTIKSMSKDNKAAQVEFKIKYLRCEEDVLSDEPEKQKNVNLNTPGIIDKLLTFEGVEVLIDGRCVCKLGGKHMIKIKANESRSDLQLYVGSPLMVIITSTELKQFVDVFSPPKDVQIKQNFSEKMMSSTDFARIEQQLHFDVMGSRNGLQAQTRNQSTWAGIGLHANTEATFLPLRRITDEPEPEESATSQFSFYIKIPGIWMCLLDRAETSPAFSVPLVNSNFASVNDYLDDLLGERSHLRLLALPIQMEVTFTSISLIVGDAMVLERCGQVLTPILYSEDYEEQISSPKYRCDIIGESVSLTCSTTACLTLDPTFLERLENYLVESSPQSSNTLAMSIQVSCDKVKAKVLFPIPDLRSEEERVEEEGLDGLSETSKLRAESVSVIMDEMSFRTDLRTTSVACDKVVAILHQPGQEDVSFAEAHRNPVDQIELIVRTGVSSANVHQLDDYDESPFFEGGMEDSIYISNSKSTQATDAFQIKRKVIKGQGAENESVVGPSDRENATSFLEQAGSQTERKIELTVPTLDVKVDKRQLEVIYNRFGNDLVFWKPSCSETCETPDQPTTKPPTYYACKSGLVDSLDSDSSFHSFEGAVSSKFENQTTCVLNIHEMNFNAVLDNQAVQCINGQNVLVGVVLGLDSDKTRNIFICGDKASLTQDRCKILASNIFTDSLSSLNMTFQIRLETEEVKQLKIALQVNDMAMHSLDVEVFKNFWDVIKITDEPVLGYKPPAVVTELHISLINGAIAIEKPEVRPALFTFDDVYITSMVLKNTSETLFRFIVEEGSLYFSRTRRRPRSLKDCICVLDSGITDLNLKVRDEHIEFKISNNVINARVCGDSLKALCDLITSLATPANLATSPETVSEVNSPMPDTDLADNELISDALNDVNGHDEDSKSDVSEQSSSGGEAGKIDESGFWILGDDDVGTGIKRSAEPQIRVLAHDAVKVVDNHFGVTKSRPLPEMLSATVERYLLEELSVALSLYGGQDFSDDDRDSDKEYDKNYYETKLDTDYGDDHRVRFAADGTVNLWESLDLMSVPGMKAGSSSTSGVKDKSQGGKNRQSDVCVQLYLSKIKSLYETFEPSFHASWRFVLMINEIEIRDRVSSSKINKMLYEYCSESLPRRNNANMLFVKATSLKNDADHNDECDIKVSVKPLRVNVDQDTLMFLVEFFSGISPKANSTPVNLERRGSTASMASSPTTKDQQNSLSSHVYDSSEHLKNEDTQSTTSSSSKPSGMYVKSFVFSPDVPIRLDYQGKRMDFEQGALAGILMGLAQLNESELRLKRLSNKSGMLGLDRVALYAFNEWMKDIKRYQLPSLLGGVGPMHSFVQLFQGVRDLVWMPIDQYRKDKRIVRGLQRGASSFSTSSATAVLDLANQFLYLVQNTAQFAHDVVTPPTNMRQLTNGNQLPSSQPRDFREGMTTAYAVVRDGLNNTVRNVSKASSGADDMSGAIGGVIRQLPSCFLSPAIRVAEASRSVITGARNQIAPEAKKRDQDKYKAQTHQK